MNKLEITQYTQSIESRLSIIMADSVKEYMIDIYSIKGDSIKTTKRAIIDHFKLLITSYDPTLSRQKSKDNIEILKLEYLSLF